MDAPLSNQKMNSVTNPSLHGKHGTIIVFPYET